ncbi:hypothetical protein D3C85_1550170 [compost metagenome]
MWSARSARSQASNARTPINDGLPGMVAAGSGWKRFSRACCSVARALTSWPRAYCSRIRMYSSRVAASFLALSVGDSRPETTPTARLASMT